MLNNLKGRELRVLVIIFVKKEIVRGKTMPESVYSLTCILNEIYKTLMPV